MKLFLITATNTFTKEKVFAVSSPFEWEGSICFDLTWLNEEDVVKRGNFSFIVVVTENEKNIIESFWSQKESHIHELKGNDASEWCELKENSDYENVQFQEIK